MPLYLNASTPRRPLPLLTDILGALHAVAAAAGAEFVVFSNADIGLQPDFYAKAVQLARRRGAVAINRVEIPDVTVDPVTRLERPWTVNGVGGGATGGTAKEKEERGGGGGGGGGTADLDAILAAARRAPQKHHGYDCFVWRTELTPLVRVAVGNLCVGCESYLLRSEFKNMEYASLTDYHD